LRLRPSQATAFLVIVPGDGDDAGGQTWQSPGCRRAYCPRQAGYRQIGPPAGIPCGLAAGGAV